MAVLSQSPANFLPGGLPLFPQTPRRQFCGAPIYKGATEVSTQPSDNRTPLFNPCCPERPAAHLDVRMITVAQPPKSQPSRPARICSRPARICSPIMGSPSWRREVPVAGTWGCSQESGRDECWYSARFLLFIPPMGPSPWKVPLISGCHLTSLSLV